MIPQSRYYYALLNKKQGGYVCVYCDKKNSRSPLLTVFRRTKDASDARFCIEEGMTRLTPDNACLVRETDEGKNQLIAVPRIERGGFRGGENSLRLETGMGESHSVRFHYERRMRDEEVSEKVELIMAPLSEHKMLQLPIERGIGIAVLESILRSDVRGLTFSCHVIDPIKGCIASPTTLETPW